MATTAATLDEVGEHRMIIGETHEDMLVLTLESQEKDIFVIPKKIALQSILIQTMVKSDPQETRIVLPNIKSSLLRKVIEYITYHDKLIPKMIEAPMTSTDMKTLAGEWDAHFIDVDLQSLFEIIDAANYMDVAALLNLTCAKIATHIKGKTPEEIRQTFNIENDFTPEEIATINEDNKWADDL